MNEREICRDLVEWVKAHVQIYPALELFHHIPNESRASGRRLHAAGFISGLPDYCLPRGSLYLEIKAQGKKPSVKQQYIIDRLNDFGNYALCTDDLETAIKTVKQFAEQYRRFP